MKIKGLLLAAFSFIGLSGIWAQGIEYDDMYFTAEDRAKLRAQRATELGYRISARSEKSYDYEDFTNPTDSYSARNVNPEYTARAHSKTAAEAEQDYYVENYQYNRNKLNNWNNNFNDWYSNPWYRTNYFGPVINNWHSPYYGYNSWNSPWYDPFWAYNGWSSSFSFHFGSAWNYGWGGYYNYWNRPYYGWDPFYYDPFYRGLGWYSGAYWNHWRYPGTIVVINNGEGSGRKVVQGKRPVRSTAIVSDRNATRSRSTINSSIRDDQNNSGRMNTTNTRQAEYYNRYNRIQRSGTTPSSYDSRSSTQYNRSRNWNDSWNNNSSWDNNRSTNRTSTPSYSPSRSSSGVGTRVNTGGSTGGRRGRD